MGKDRPSTSSRRWRQSSTACVVRHEMSKASTQINVTNQPLQLVKRLCIYLHVMWLFQHAETKAWIEHGEMPWQTQYAKLLSNMHTYIDCIYDTIWFNEIKIRCAPWAIESGLPVLLFCTLLGGDPIDLYSNAWGEQPYSSMPALIRSVERLSISTSDLKRL